MINFAFQEALRPIIGGIFSVLIGSASAFSIPAWQSRVFQSFYGPQVYLTQSDTPPARDPAPAPEAAPAPAPAPEPAPSPAPEPAPAPAPEPAPSPAPEPAPAPAPEQPPTASPEQPSYPSADSDTNGYRPETPPTTEAPVGPEPRPDVGPAPGTEGAPHRTDNSGPLPQPKNDRFNNDGLRYDYRPGDRKPDNRGRQPSNQDERKFNQNRGDEQGEDNFENRDEEEEKMREQEEKRQKEREAKDLARMKREMKRPQAELNKTKKLFARYATQGVALPSSCQEAINEGLAALDTALKAETMEDFREANMEGLQETFEEINDCRRQAEMMLNVKKILKRVDKEITRVSRRWTQAKAKAPEGTVEAVADGDAALAAIKEARAKVNGLLQEGDPDEIESLIEDEIFGRFDSVEAAIQRIESVKNAKRFLSQFNKQYREAQKIIAKLKRLKKDTAQAEALLVKMKAQFENIKGLKPGSDEYEEAVSMLAELGQEFAEAAGSTEEINADDGGGVNLNLPKF